MLKNFNEKGYLRYHIHINKIYGWENSYLFRIFYLLSCPFIIWKFGAWSGPTGVQIAVVFRVSKDHFYRVNFLKKLVYVKLCCLLKIYVAGD